MFIVFESEVLGKIFATKWVLEEITWGYSHI